ncbi:LysR family transcriptional regulator [Gilliamella sp. wkB108]|uniref:LysR family transcriptional regulator n=1 Tax=Gilliamella sp. wkB108 TaxID=3120256 RepID=UPI0009BE1491|nr:LysR family transcriptional regulator [Gilliamella apicola]
MKGIDIKLLHAFVKLAEKGNYSHAAKSLFLTQPALSKQIKALEKLTNGQLFFRGRHGATLTSFGEQLYPKANEILQSHVEFLNYAKQLNNPNHEKLFIGFGISSFQNVPHWINQFRQQYPECDVEINQLPSSVQMEMLQEGGLHAGFVRMPITKNLASQVIHEEILALAVPTICDIEPTDIQRILSAYPLLQLDPLTNPCLAAETTLFLQNNLLNANQVSITGDMTTLLALVAGGNGIALLPKSVQHFLPDGVKLLIPPNNQIRWEIGVSWNPELKNCFRDDFLKIVMNDIT